MTSSHFWKAQHGDFYKTTKKKYLKMVRIRVRKVMIPNSMMNQTMKTNPKMMTLNFQMKMVVDPTAQNVTRMKVMKALIGTRWNNKLMKKIRKLLSEGRKEVITKMEVPETRPDQEMQEEDESH